MTILFIHSFDYYEPLGIMSLSSTLKKNGHHCELLDIGFEKDYIAQIKIKKPDIIAYSITTNNWKRYQKVNLDIKEQFGFLSVFGGPHCTFFPEFINQTGVDVICRGEGELAFAELADNLQKGADICRIQNLWIKKGDKIFKNELRPLIEDLDTLPFPDRELVNKYNHYRKRSRVRTMTSRGCPYNCSYCFNHAYKELYHDKGKMIRHRSPQNVICEVKELKVLYSPRNIEFHDDIFILNKNWTEEFIALYKKEKINIPYEINVRVELVTPEIVHILKDSGCYCVQFGIESGNVQFRKDILNRNMSNDQILEAAHLFRQANIKVNTYNMIGLPGETLDDSFSTLFLNQKCKPTYAMNTIFHPYPQNKISELSIFNGSFDGDYSKYGKNLFYGGSVINSKDMKKMLRLHYLFAFGVKIPASVPFIRFLIKLPFNKFYQAMYFLFRAYVIMFVFKRLRISEIFLRK